MVTRPAISLAQDRESSPARTGENTMLRHHLHVQEKLLTLVLLCIARIGLLDYKNNDLGGQETSESLNFVGFSYKSRRNSRLLDH